jgi:hypothetical protein
MRQHWAGLGGGGLTVSFEMLRKLYEEGYISIGANNGGNSSNKPPTGSEPDKKSGEFEPYIFDSDGSIGVVYYGADSDDQILSSLESTDPQGYKQIIRPYENYMQILTGRGAGTGGVPERIQRITEEYPEIRQWISRVTSSMSGIFNPFFSLDGGSGFGFFETHMSMIGRNEINRPSTVMPVAISPHRTEANRRVAWSDQDIDRRASDNVSLATERIESLLSGKGAPIDFCLLVDNDFAAFNQMCNQKDEYDYKYLFDKIHPIITDGDYSEFNASAKQNLNHENANAAITRNLLPVYVSLLRAPNNVRFGKTTQSGFDHNDLNAHLSGYVIPSNLSLSSRNAIDGILGNYDVKGYENKLAYMTYYTFHASCAPFDGDKVNDLKIFIWDDTRNQPIGGAVKESIVDLFSDVGLTQPQISVHPVKGISDPQSRIKIWTLTSVEEVSDMLDKKFM